MAKFDINLYQHDGSLATNRVVSMSDKTLSFNPGTTQLVNQFSVDGSTFSVDALNNRVGINNSAPFNELSLSNNTFGTNQLARAGKDNIITALASEIKASNKLLNYDGVLSVYQKELKGKAPDLQIGSNNGQEYRLKTIDLSKQKSKYTLLVYYQSGCGPCQEMMQGLQGNYKNLLAQDIKVITIAADTDEQIFKSSASQYPWPDKYWDEEGFKGINFKNYAVIGTPTMYIIDSKGIIVQKMSGIPELLDWMKMKK